MDGARMTNITEEHKKQLEAIQDCENIALMSCFVGDEPAAAIVAINKDEAGDYILTPLFVSVTPNMDLKDHDGVKP